MSKRGTILLAVGMLALGLVLGFVGGGVATRFATGRANARGLAMRGFAPGSFYGAPRAMPRLMPMPFTQRGFQRGGMPSGPGFQSRRAPAMVLVNGARVTSIEANSPAEKAGLKAGDVITAVAGTSIDRSHSFESLLQSHKPSEKIDLTVNRGGTPTTLSATLGASPQNSNTAYLGIRYAPAFQRAQRNR